MANAAAEAKQYWGFLIAADKAPTPKFEQLLLAIAHYIVGITGGSRCSG